MDLRGMLAGMSDEQIRALVAALPADAVSPLAAESADKARTVAAGPLEQAQTLDPKFRVRPHLQYLSDRLAAAVTDVENGRSRMLAVSVPPRMGKSHLTSIYLPAWLLAKHPTWTIGMVSHSPTLATRWGRQVRRIVETHGPALGVGIARDAGAVAEWETTSGGGVLSRSAPGQSVTGFGFRVIILDDLVKDFAAAHSENARNALWDWWIANGYTRLEPPYLAVALGTRWHEDDFIGRLLSPEHEGDPADWEQIVLPALAGPGVALGRAPGVPLLSPIIEETPDEAAARWAALRATVGEYVWNALYQQEPSSPRGAIFDVGWWRYHTQDPAQATDDGRVVYVPAEALARGEWVDSWDTSFKGTESSDYVVGQRWCRLGPLKLLVAQQRGRWGITDALAAMRRWTDADPSGAVSPFGQYVHTRLVEDAANGPAVVEMMKGQVRGMRAVTPRGSKESRARAVAPSVERGEVLLPLPSDLGNAWVGDLLSELREFSSGRHDDQVDSLTQALLWWGGPREGAVTVPAGAVLRETPGHALGPGRRGGLGPSRNRAGFGGRGLRRPS